jgi:lipopolysaccharide/colanic/teichoic acid biosynthesis glycosyltransferase
MSRLAKEGALSEHQGTISFSVAEVASVATLVASTAELATEAAVAAGVTPFVGLSRSAMIVKRGFDLVFAVLGLLLLAPLSLLIALAIRIDSPGPVLFRQMRVGRGGTAFRMLKFRTMFDGTEAERASLAAFNETKGIFKMRKDPRLTLVGGRLRRASLDELPQLINVLRGEMSLIGPRPLVPEEDQLVEGSHRARLLLTPGMTGPWQTHGPIRPPLDQMVLIDSRYGEQWSLWTDVSIVLRTVWHVMRLRGI